MKLHNSSVILLVALFVSGAPFAESSDSIPSDKAQGSLRRVSSCNTANNYEDSLWKDLPEGK